jgi:MFS family permease
MNKGRVKNSLRVSFLDGVFASCMMGFTSEYIIPYALALKASVRQVGILSALPNLVSSLVQLKSADLTDKIRSKKKIVVTFVLFQALTGIPIILIPFLFKGFEVAALIILVTIFTSFNAFCLPAWHSLMSDYLPSNKRGAYFGWRNKILGAVTIACIFIAGFILYLFKQDTFKGFFVIFSIAFLSRLISWYFLTRMYEPPFKVNKEAYFSFVDFLRRARRSNFAKFVIFAASFSFCVNIASPFFPVFMLKNLKFDYLTYTLIVITVPLTTIFTIGRWGRVADRIGNLKVLKTTAILITILPALWIINRDPVYLIFAQIISGFAWAGFNLCAVNFIYDAVTAPKRVRCISYFNVFSGAAIFLGALLGGYLVNYLPSLLGYKLLTLFLISSVLRLSVVLFFSSRIKEVRPVEDISAKDLFFSVVGIKQSFRDMQE